MMPPMPMTARPAATSVTPATADVPPAGPRQLYIAWIEFQRRAVSMQQFLGFELQHVPPPFASRWLKPLGYLAQAFRTARLLRAARPAVVWVQTPPTFVPLLLVALRPLAGPYRILADCHNGALEPPWSRVPGATRALNRCDRVLVHNAEARPMAEALGVAPGRITVLEDPPPQLTPPAPAAAAAAPPAPYVLVPCSFAADEPIPMLLAAARLAPEIAFRITGNRRKAETLGYLAAVPANVSFTGFLSVAEFNATLWNAAVVLGLTSVEGIQLSVANEALGAHRALVLSDTRILRAMFGDAALMAENRPEALAAALRGALAQRPALEARSAALKVRRQAEWRQSVAALLGA